MSKIVINGGNVLNGEIRISGAKNSVVGLICGAILSDDIVTLESVPNIEDVHSLITILELLGCKVTYQDELMVIDPREIKSIEIPEKEASKLRASYYLMGAYISKFNEVIFGLPGGCNLGDRPINLHLFGFERLNCSVSNVGGKYHINTNNLVGEKIFLDFASVGATINLMFAAVKAKGTTTIENAAEEPEIVDIANFLNSMGAKVRGAGTSIIRIEGVTKLNGTTHQVIPDRIQAGTYILLGAMCSEKLTIKNVIPLHLDSLLSKLEFSGVKFDVGNDEITVYGKQEYNEFDVRTQTYPGFPTDLQQPLSVFLTQVKGGSTIIETIYTERFRHIEYLNSMGANIKRINDGIFIVGPTKLHGNTVVATDLRASSALVLAGLVASGTTTILEVEHLIRGYDNIIEKLKAVGADISFYE